MTGAGSATAPDEEGLRPAFAASRAHVGLVVLLCALAAVGWWWTAAAMSGMDNGPWSGLGSLGWFLSVWVVMMAAMTLFFVLLLLMAMKNEILRRRVRTLELSAAAGA